MKQLTPLQTTCQWLNTEVKATVKQLKKAKHKNKHKKMKFNQQRLEELGFKILHTDRQMQALGLISA